MQLGVALVKELNSARMIVDVAHPGVKTSFDAIETSSTLVIISHANSRNKYDSNRKVPDDLIKAITKIGGFIGAVMYPAYLTGSAARSMASSGLKPPPSGSGTLRMFRRDHEGREDLQALEQLIKE